MRRNPPIRLDLLLQPRQALRQAVVLLAPHDDLVQAIQTVVGRVDAGYHITVQRIDAGYHVSMDRINTLVGGIDAAALISELDIKIIEPFVGDL